MELNWRNTLQLDQENAVYKGFSKYPNKLEHFGRFPFDDKFYFEFSEISSDDWKIIFRNFPEFLSLC